MNLSFSVGSFQLANPDPFYITKHTVLLCWLNSIGDLSKDHFTGFGWSVMQDYHTPSLTLSVTALTFSTLPPPKKNPPKPTHLPHYAELKGGLYKDCFTGFSWSVMQAI